MSTQTPTLADMARAIVGKSIGLVRTSVPAVVLSYDRDTQRARIRACVTVPFRDPETGLIVEYVQPPAVSNVPVQWSGGAHGALTIDLNEGDMGVMLISDRDISAWKATGNDSNAPSDSRRMDQSDAIFIPGIYPSGGTLPSDAHANGAVVLSGDDVRLGSATASDFVALASLVDDRLDTLRSALSEHTHGGGTLLAPSSGGTVTGLTGEAGAIVPFSSVAADKVKAK